jgi:hypothetical protein
MTDKYTAAEWALLEGGHEFEPEKKGLSFMQELGEARMFKTRDQIQKQGSQKLTNHLFANLLSLYVMSQDYNYAPVAAQYARKTTAMGSFNRPSPSGTDLFQTVHSLKRPEYFKGNAKDDIQMSNINVNDAQIKRFLNKIKSGKVSANEAAPFFMKMERDLKIDDPKLRATRRLATDWDRLNTAQRQLAGNHLNKYFRTQANRSDMMPLFGQFAKDNNLNIGPSRSKQIAKQVARKGAAFAAGYMIGKNLEV